MPVGGQTDLARAEQIVGGAGHEQASARRRAQFGESGLVGTRIGLVIADALGRHDDIEVDARAGNRRRPELFRAVCHHAEPQAVAPQGAEYFVYLRPGFEFLISGSDTSGECSRKADLPRSFSDKGFVEPVTAGLVSPPQVGGAPLAAALFASGN